MYYKDKRIDKRKDGWKDERVHQAVIAVIAVQQAVVAVTAVMVHDRFTKGWLLGPEVYNYLQSFHRLLIGICSP